MRRKRMKNGDERWFFDGHSTYHSLFKRDSRLGRLVHSIKRGVPVDPFSFSCFLLNIETDLCYFTNLEFSRTAGGSLNKNLAVLNKVIFNIIVLYESILPQTVGIIWPPTGNILSVVLSTNDSYLCMFQENYTCLA